MYAHRPLPADERTALGEVCPDPPHHPRRQEMRVDVDEAGQAERQRPVVDVLITRRRVHLRLAAALRVGGFTCASRLRYASAGSHAPRGCATRRRVHMRLAAALRVGGFTCASRLRYASAVSVDSPRQSANHDRRVCGGRRRDRAEPQAADDARPKPNAVRLARNDRAPPTMKFLLRPARSNNHDSSRASARAIRQSRRQDHAMTRPPEMSRVTPVTQPDASEAR